VHYKLLGELDLNLGVWAEVESPFDLITSTSTNRPSWWRAANRDRFSAELNFTLAAFVGLQSSY
jgi:AAA+ superfamily predicted ATPase